MSQVLLFGGTGQIGRPLLRRLQQEGRDIIAVSRTAQVDEPRVRWLRGDLGTPPALPGRVDAVVSCGPLDAFARWYASGGIESPRVVAFGSTSVATKHASLDPAERDLAERLRVGEDTLLSTALARGTAATVLRPTLVYGAGRDVTLTRIALLAQRFGFFPLPGDACGLRQPVHVDDLAGAAQQVLGAPVSFGRAYDVPGGETVAYDQMVARVLAALQPAPRLIRVPAPLFRWAAGLSRIGGGGIAASVVERMRADLVFDPGPAQRDFSYRPRGFRPTSEMFVLDPEG